MRFGGHNSKKNECVSRLNKSFHFLSHNLQMLLKYVTVLLRFIYISEVEKSLFAENLNLVKIIS